MITCSERMDLDDWGEGEDDEAGGVESMEVAMRNLYHIQDDDRPVYILAETWGDAVHAWRLLVVEENDIGEDEEPNPKGVTFVARHGDVLIVPAKHVPPCGGPDGGCTCGLEGGET